MKKTSNKVIRDTIIITAVFLVATLILYGYYWFFTPHKLQLIYQNWDGPSYVVVAKSFYNPKIIEAVNNTKLGTKEFALHLPLYPVFIRIFSFIGYYRSMLFVNQLFSLMFILAFYHLIKLINPKINALYASLALIFFTPRWFILSHVGSSESVMLFFLTLSLFFLTKKKFVLAGLSAGLAQLARSQVILFFVGIFLYYLSSVYIFKTKTFNKALKEFWPFFFIPLALLATFLLYQFQYGDFLAYVHRMGDFKHLQLPPYYVFARFLLPIDMGIWKEALIFDYLLYSTSVLLLFKQKLYPFAFIALAMYFPVPFVAHVDVSRYAIPLLPFVFIAFNKLFSSKTFFIALLLVVPAIYNFAIGFINFNLAP